MAIARSFVSALVAPDVVRDDPPSVSKRAPPPAHDVSGLRGFVTRLAATTVVWERR